MSIDNSDRVLVTGAGGFIGSHLTEELLLRGHRVRAFIRYTSSGTRGWLDDIPKEMQGRLEVVFGDIRDRRAVHEACMGCRHIYHLAALIGIPYSYIAPDSYVEVNVRGTTNILEAARELGVERTLITSTSEVYGTAVYTPIDEAHPLQAQSPYSATKIGADQVALSYWRSFGLPVVLVRPFNTYGPRQSTRAVLPTIITQALAGHVIRLGSLTTSRDLVFVGDTVAGFIALADSDDCIGRVTNLATGVAVTVGELVQRVERLLGRGLSVVASEERKRPENSEVFQLLGCAKAARERAGWAATTLLEEGLQQTVQWFHNHPDTWRSGAYGI